MSKAEQHPARLAEQNARFLSGLEPFALFCAYHLGIGEDNRCRFQNVNEVARRFGVSVSEVQEALRAYALDSDTLINMDFDLAGAQADVQVSPPGVDLVSLARMHYDALLEAAPKSRDWEAELADAAAENELIFGTPQNPDTEG